MALTSFLLNLKIKTCVVRAQETHSCFPHLDQNCLRKKFPTSPRYVQQPCHLPGPPSHAVKGKKNVSLPTPPCLPSLLMNITASSCATGAAGFSLDFSQVIIQVRICHPQNERKMNLQSQMQIYLLKKKRVEGRGREKWAKEGKNKEKKGMCNRERKL